MKRDNDLSRAILIFVQDHLPPGGGLDVKLDIPGYDLATTVAHAELLIEDHYIDGRVLKGQGGSIHIVVTKLTNRGHDAIAATHDNETWNTVKRTAREKGVALTFEVAIALAKRLIATHLGLPPPP
jgi:hypothetical protein